MTISNRTYYLLFVILIGSWLSGCATTTMQLARSPLERPIKVLVLQKPMTINPENLQKVLAPNIKQSLTISDEPLAQGVTLAQDHVLGKMGAELAKQSNTAVVVPPAGAQPLLDKLRSKPLEASITQEEADSIQRTTGADALLKFQITDYGLTPQSWKKGYITFEVVTTLAIAAAIYYTGYNVAKAAAGAYLIQETAEETAEAYTGFWALNVIYRPVRIKAELIQLHPVVTVWKGRDTGMSNRRLSRLTEKVSPSEVKQQLNQSSDDAVKTIVGALSKYLSN